MGVYKKDPKDITYAPFTRNYKPKYKCAAVENLFNSVGIFFSTEEVTQLKSLDAIASTRDSIAHGDISVEITRKEFSNRLSDICAIYDLLKKKLR